MLSVKIKEIGIAGYTKPLLSNINFEIKGGEVVSVLGRNGSGKTTLINALGNLLNPDIYNVKGEVFLNEKNLLSIDYNDLLIVRKHDIKYVFQDAKSCFDPLRRVKYYFDEIAGKDKDPDDLFNYFLLPSKKEIEKYYPHELSGGMAQRLAIVIALLCNPYLLILDEPTSSLDYGTANLLKQKLTEFTKDSGRMVLMVTQDVEFAVKVSDRIIYLDEGRLVKEYSKDEFKSMEIDKLIESLTP